MSSAKITLYSFAEYMNDNNLDLFDNLNLPEGIDKETLTDNILLKGGEFEVLYSNPNFLRYSIGIWSRKWYRTFEKWINALNIDYEPLENYNRIENSKDITDKDTGNTRTLNNEDKTTLNNEDKTTLNNEDKRTLDTSNTAENKVSAYDSSSYQNANKTTTDDDGTITDNHTGTVTDNHTGTVTDNHTGTIKDEYSDDTTFTHSSRIHGNIGVTTSQQMLQSELDIARWNIYEHITDLFLTEFVIPIYS